MSIRPEIQRLLAEGQFPSALAVSDEKLERIQNALSFIRQPVTDTEAERLLYLFGSDDLFGLSFTLLHLIESAPGWMTMGIPEELKDNFWIEDLKERRDKSRG